MHLWRSDYSPFIRWAQLQYCRRLIVVPLSTFHRLAELIGDPKGELIFFFHTGRCGSTLLSQVIHDVIQRYIARIRRAILLAQGYVFVTFELIAA